MAHWRQTKGLNFSRKVVTANKSWDCAALCGREIPPREDYIQDAVFDGVAHSETLRYHLMCAIPNRKTAKETTLTYFNEMCLGAKS